MAWRELSVSTVMLIDDEPDILTIGRLALERIGKFKVLLANSGREGLNLALTHLPDVILLDATMEDLDGLATMREIRKHPTLQKTPIIFLTAKIQRHEVEEFLSLGAIGFIPKPFNPLTLADEIKKIVTLQTLSLSRTSPC